MNKDYIPGLLRFHQCHLGWSMSHHHKSNHRHHHYSNSLHRCLVSGWQFRDYFFWQVFSQLSCLKNFKLNNLLLFTDVITLFNIMLLIATLRYWTGIGVHCCQKHEIELLETCIFWTSFSFLSQVCTGWLDRMSHRKWRETKQQLIWWPEVDGLGWCLGSLYFLCDIMSSHPVIPHQCIHDSKCNNLCAFVSWLYVCRLICEMRAT